MGLLAKPVTEASAPELFELYRRILRELRARGIVRTDNAPAGDYAEYLVAAAFDGQLATSPAEKSWDVVTRTGRRLQVKCRVVSSPPSTGQLQLSPFRTFDFDDLVIVLLSDLDYAVRRAVLLPREAVEKHARLKNLSGQFHGYVLHARDEVLSVGEDVTALLRAASGTESP